VFIGNLKLLKKKKSHRFIFSFLLFLHFTHMSSVFRYQWCGIGITVMGIALVGTSSYMSPQDSEGSALLVLVGNLLVIVSQVMSAFQMVRK
jgi:drug/metabolite transporter (DMT)-like permease